MAKKKIDGPWYVEALTPGSEGVKVIHIPTGESETCDSEGDAWSNTLKARNRLKERLVKKDGR